MSRQHLGPLGTLLFAAIDIGTPQVLKLSIVSTGSMNIGTRQGIRWIRQNRHFFFLRLIYFFMSKYCCR